MHREPMFQLVSNIVKNIEADVFSEHRLKIVSLRIGKHCIVKNIASLRKVNITQPPRLGVVWSGPMGEHVTVTEL